MDNSTSCPSNDSRMKFWLMLAAFVAVYALFRLPWITCDPGIPSMWEYGYNATDEGYYLSGGKEKFLWGHFVDLVRGEAPTYGYSAGTHWLSYLAYLAFGLSSWAWRLPFFAVYLCAWIFMFRHIARRTGAFSAFALCSSVSLIPMVVAYERTASNDALISAMLVMSFVCAAGRSTWRAAAAGLISGAIVLVKPSVWVLLPIAAAGIAEGTELRHCIKRICVFAGVAIASSFVWKFAVALSVAPDAAHAGVSTWELLRRTAAHYPLPAIFDFASHFKGLSSFPRDPSAQMLGAAAPLILSVPLAMAARNVLSRRWNGHLLLFLAVPAYVAAVSVMNTIYTHYFLPVITILPIMACAISQEAECGSGDGERVGWRRLSAVLSAAFLLCAVGCLFLASCNMHPSQSQNFYSRIYNLPQSNVWGLTWPFILAFVAAVVAAAAVLRRFRVEKTRLALWIPVAFVAASVVFAVFPATQIAPYAKKAASVYFAPMAVSMAVSAAMFLMLLGFKEKLPSGTVAFFAVPACLFASYLAIPDWRSAFAELAGAGTHIQEDVGKEIASLVPPDAIVIGERANQVLMSQPVRTASTCSSNSDPIPVMESILKAEPEARMYALADSQHAYNLQHYQKHADKYRLRHVKTFKMPSFGTGRPADVHLLEIQVTAPRRQGN